MLQLTHRVCGMTFMVGDAKGNDKLPDSCPNPTCPEPTRADFEILGLLGETREGVKVVWHKRSRERL